MTSDVPPGQPMPTILQGDARAVPLPDESVDLVVTSPPYFKLRSYTDGGEHYDGQLGAEATPAEFIAALIECTREMVRVLKPAGSIFVNLGDKYSTGHPGARGRSRHTPTGVPAKSLHLIPERYRIAAVDELHLVARAVIIWSKPNGLPEPVTDRVRRAHEDWVHLTKGPHYYSAIDELRRPYEGDRALSRRIKHPGEGKREQRAAWEVEHPRGGLPGSVWEIATQPLRAPAELGVDHLAAFPMEWPRRLIQGWCPREVCTACGDGRRPATGRARASRQDGCGCPDTAAATAPGVVLDPFGGTGTTALVATMLGRHGISLDLSADYCRLAEWRASDPKQRDRAARAAKPRAAAA